MITAFKALNLNIKCGIQDIETFNMETTNVQNAIESFKTYSDNCFEFSEFQMKACENIMKRNHILVTAHTGSGKTLPAEFAIYYYIKVLGKKVIYTSPIKALSNQKYNDFTRQFNDISVGLLTGDIKHNPDADLLIMTTEILQNHCFKMSNADKNAVNYLDFNIDLQNELGSVVFDEVNYIDDPDRGTVWEQTMIMLPNDIPFVMLSATIGKKDIFMNWIEKVTNKTCVNCHTSTRVVPWQFYEFFTIPDHDIEKTRDKTIKTMYESKINRFHLIKSDTQYHYNVLNTTRRCKNEMMKNKLYVNEQYVINECLSNMKQHDMFPCLVFVFSRKRVETIAKSITCNLYNEGEKDSNIESFYRQFIVSKIRNWKEYQRLPEYSTYLNLLEKGIGIHHAGMLPVFREMIEIMYAKKMIKVLVATETFAIGLNMPTRSVVFSSLHKHDGHKIRRLHGHEFTQMAGRAGRRNIDTIGNVILLTNMINAMDENEYYKLFFTSPKVLKSKFKITYNLILNFIRMKTKKVW